jgi:hypothetical protein
MVLHLEVHQVQMVARLEVRQVRQVRMEVLVALVV